MSDTAPFPTGPQIKRLRERIATWSDHPAPAELVEAATQALKSRKSKRDATSRNKAYRAFADQLPADDPVTWFQLAIGVTGEAGCWATSRGGEVRELLDWCDECLLLMGEGEELTADRGRQWKSVKLGATFERDLAAIIDQLLSAPVDEAPSADDAPAKPAAEATGDDSELPTDAATPEPTPMPDGEGPDSATEAPAATAVADASTPAVTPPSAPEPEPVAVPEPTTAPDTAASAIEPESRPSDAGAGTDPSTSDEQADIDSDRSAEPDEHDRP